MNIAQASIFKRQWFRVGFSALFAVVFLSMAILPIASINSQKTISNAAVANPSHSELMRNSTIYRAEAGSLISFACGGIGYNMNQSNSWGKKFGSIPLADKPNRRFTLQEAFGNSLRFPSYYGEGEGEEMVRAKENKPPEFVTVDKAKLEAERTFESCFFSRLTLSFASGGFVLADAVTMLTQFIVRVAFDPNLVCNRDETSQDDDSCLDLISVIGGESNDDTNSIIGSLTNSLYFPLLTIAAITMGVWVFWQGIVKRKLRQAFGGLIYSLLIVILGIVAVLNPVLLTKAPMTISSTAANCILGAFSGQNCIGGTYDGGSSDGSVVDGNSGSELICSSSASGTGFTDQMQLTINSTTCQIWKSFVLNPYSIASFGLPFDELDTKDPDAKGADFVAAASGVSADDFCVNLSSSRSAEDMEHDTLILDSTSNNGNVCNIAAYQLYLMTNAKSGADTLPEDGEDDERWYKIVEVAGNNDDMWGAWTSSSVSAMNKLGISLMSVFITLVGNLVILITGVFTVVYYISGIILMAFAPIFLLIGIHPGRGRKIMLGWMEKIVSNVLKYIVSAAFVVVTIGIYGGVLAANASLAMTILFVIVVTMALLMYRKEFVEMIGRADMGGEQISSSMSDKLRQYSDSGRDLALAGVGGAIGSKMAGGKATSGFNAGIKRDLKRGTGFIANTAREFDNVKNNNRGNLERQLENAKRNKDADRQERLTQALQGRGYDSNLNPVGQGGNNQSRNENGSDSTNSKYRGNEGEEIENDMKKALHEYDAATDDVKEAENEEKKWDSYIDAKNEIAVELQNDPELMKSLIHQGQLANPNLSAEELTPLAQNSIQLFVEDVQLQNEEAVLNGKISALNAAGRFEEAEELQLRKDEISTRRMEIKDGINGQTYDQIKGHYDKNLSRENIATPEVQTILSKIDNIDTSRHSEEDVQAFEEYRFADSEYHRWRDLSDEFQRTGDISQANNAFAKAEEALDTRDAILSENPNNVMISQMNQLKTDLSMAREPEVQTILSKIDNIDTSRHSEEDVQAFEEYRFADSEYHRWRDLSDEFQRTGDIGQANNAFAKAEEALDTRDAILSENPNNVMISQMNQIKTDSSMARESANHDDMQVIESGYAEANSDKFAAEERMIAAKSSIDALQDVKLARQEQEHNEDAISADIDNFERERRTRSEIEIENTERALEGLHPGQGISRRQLKKIRLEAGKELQDEDYNVSPQRYARQRARQDVRGEKLYDDSRGVPMPQNQDIPLPEMPLHSSEREAPIPNTNNDGNDLRGNWNDNGPFTEGIPVPPPRDNGPFSGGGSVIPDEKRESAQEEATFSRESMINRERSNPRVTRPEMNNSDRNDYYSTPENKVFGDIEEFQPNTREPSENSTSGLPVPPPKRPDENKVFGDIEEFQPNTREPSENSTSGLPVPPPKRPDENKVFGDIKESQPNTRGPSENSTSGLPVPPPKRPDENKVFGDIKESQPNTREPSENSTSGLPVPPPAPKQDDGPFSKYVEPAQPREPEQPKTEEKPKSRWRRNKEENPPVQSDYAEEPFGTVGKGVFKSPEPVNSPSENEQPKTEEKPKSRWRRKKEESSPVESDYAEGPFGTVGKGVFKSPEPVNSPSENEQPKTEEKPQSRWNRKRTRENNKNETIRGLPIPPIGESGNGIPFGGPSMIRPTRNTTNDENNEPSKRNPGPFGNNNGNWGI